MRAKTLVQCVGVMLVIGVVAACHPPHRTWSSEAGAQQSAATMSCNPLSRFYFFCGSWDVCLGFYDPTTQELQWAETQIEASVPTQPETGLLLMHIAGTQQVSAFWARATRTDSSPGKPAAIFDRPFAAEIAMFFDDFSQKFGWVWGDGYYGPRSATLTFGSFSDGRICPDDGWLPRDTPLRNQLTDGKVCLTMLDLNAEFQTTISAYSCDSTAVDSIVVETQFVNARKYSKLLFLPSKD